MSSYFIGCRYHFENTKSSQFFIDILKSAFTDLCITDSIENISNNNIDTLIIWQQLLSPEKIDFVQAKNVILVPMYDDCPHTAVEWEPYKKYKIFCFSKTLFNLLSKNDFDCFYSQYYIKPSIKSTTIKDSINAFFWERYQTLNWTHVEKLLKFIPINHLHFHTGLSFNNNMQLRPTKEQLKKYNITYTEWFENKEDLLKILNKTQLYFAPRKTEGIGMSFIEALCQGSLVVAYNLPTMNEYITADVDGILYDENTLPEKKFSKSQLIKLQKASIERAKKGYQNWIDSIPQILEFIKKPMQNYTPKKSFKLRKKYAIQRIKKIIKILIFYDFWKKVTLS